MENFFVRFLLIFLTALGLILGGALTGSVSAALSGHSPLRTMAELAKELKIWAAVAAIGGTFHSLQTLETGLLEGQLKMVVKQLGFFFAAFAGAHLGYIMVMTLVGMRK